MARVLADAEWTIKGNKGLKYFSTLMGGTFLAQLISLLTAPLIARLYGPTEMGSLALFNAIVNLGVVIATMRYEMAIVTSEDSQEAEEIRAMIYRLATAAMLVAFAGVAAYSFMSATPIAAWHWFIPVSVLFDGLLLNETGRLNYLKNYRAISISKIVQAGSTAAWAIGAGWMGKGENFFAVSTLVGYFGGWAAIRLLVVDGPGTDVSIKGGMAALRRHGGYPKFNMPSTFLDVLSLQAPLFIFNALYSKDIAGHYALANKVLFLPLVLVGLAVSQVFFRLYSESWREDRANLQTLLLKTWASLAIVGLFPFLLLGAFGESLFVWVFGPHWAFAGKMASLLSPMLFFMFISNSSSSALLVHGKHKIGLYFSLTALIYRTASIYIGWNLKGSIRRGLAIWAACEIIQIIVYNLVIWRSAGTSLGVAGKAGPSKAADEANEVAVLPSVPAKPTATSEGEIAL